MLELLDDHEQLEEAVGIPITLADIMTFQEQVTKKLYTLIKENISSHFSFSSNVILMSIFDPRNAPKADSRTPDLSKYEEEAIGALLVQYGSEKPTKILYGNLTNNEAIITPDITTELK